MIHNNQSGRTMMEMLGVLAIMGIITYGAISGINYGMTSYKVNKLYIEIPDIINTLVRWIFRIFPLHCSCNFQILTDGCFIILL